MTYGSNKIKFIRPTKLRKESYLYRMWRSGEAVYRFLRILNPKWTGELRRWFYVGYCNMENFFIKEEFLKKEGENLGLYRDK